MIQDFPETAKFITDAERKFIQQKLKDDGQFSVSGEKFNIKYVWQSLKDWKTWISSKSSMDLPLFIIMTIWLAVMLAAG